MRPRPVVWDVLSHRGLGRLWPVIVCVVFLALVPGVSVAQQNPRQIANPPATLKDRPSVSLSQVTDYAKSGAIDLALSSIRHGQPAYSAKPKRWLRWERLKFKLLKQAGRWHQVAKAATELPHTLPANDRDAFQAAGAKAWIKLHDGQHARVLLRQLLWSGSSPPAEKRVRLWRRLLIEAYLGNNLTNDARLALLQYQSDYKIQGQSERDVFARVWLRVKDPHYALDLLKPDAHKDNWLYLLASLRAGTQPAAALEKEAEKAAQVQGIKPLSAARLWGVSAAAALERHDWHGAIIALERFIALAPHLPLNRLQTYNGDTLWNTYRHLGDQLGNQARILLGDDTSWEAAAHKAGKHKHPVEARAYNAVLALTGQTPAGRMVGYRWLLTALLAEPEGRQLVDRLFLTASKTFPHLSVLPVPVRLVLANDAVDQHNLKLAARMMVGVNQAPSGDNPFNWALRVSRVLILGGKPDKGVTKLHELITHSKTLNQKQANRLMQVLFNLQSLKLNQQAISLFKALFAHLPTAALKRQVLYWEGDSYKSMGQYRRAASLYLQSATLRHTKPYNQWGATARYNAAEALAKAHMTGDARRILKDLLARTKAPDRVTFLKQKIAELSHVHVSSTGESN